MPSGSRRKRGGDDYVFVDGRAVSVQDLAVPGQDEAAPGQEQATGQRRSRKQKGRSRVGRTLRQMDEADGLELRDDADDGGLGFGRSERLFSDDRRKMRRKCLVFGIVLVALAIVSLCISDGYYGTIYSPGEVLRCYGEWFRITFTGIVDAGAGERLRYQVMQDLPMYTDVCYTFLQVFKYIVCGILLALSGMLYQNTFRNPIAAPSMLGVSNGVNIAILVLVMQFGYAATQMMGMYYLYSYIGGAVILCLVMLGGAFISGKGRFNVVNMLLVGTIISQLLGVVLTYVQNTFLNEADWDAFYLLQTATNLNTAYTYITVAVGAVAAIVPIVLFRFRLNLVSFDDSETRLLGVNANRLRMLALVCGSIMILTAQINAGQVAMASLVVPFVVRAVFGAEFRKQLVGNVLCGAIVLLVAGDIVSFVAVSQIQLDIGSIVTVCTLPLFVWMIAVGQRGWE